MALDYRSLHFLQVHCKFGYCCNRFRIFFSNYISIIKCNMLLLHRQYCMIVHVILLTTYMTVNFNKMLETIIFQRFYAQY